MNLYIISLTTVLLVSSALETKSQTVADVIGDLPLPIIENILTILATGTVTLSGNCSGTTFDPSKIQFILYSNGNPPRVIDSSTTFQPPKPIVFVTHGWRSSPNAALPIINALLAQFDCYVIAVNNSIYASTDYQTSYCRVPFVGQEVGKFICNNLSSVAVPSNLLLVGHSLGAHISGFAGQTTIATCGKIGRIVGLDPAGPLYQDVDENRRLDKSDATFVQIDHTNAGVFGYAGNLGHVDFYPNCGSVQPSCLVFQPPLSLEIVAAILTYTDSAVSCSHSRAWDYFAESIVSNSFAARPCLLCGTPLCQKNLLVASPDVYMGEYCRSQPAFAEYTLTTNLVSPYGQGPAGPKYSTP